MNKKTKNRVYIIGVIVLIIIGIIYFKPDTSLKFSSPLSVVGECRYDGEVCGPGLQDDCCPALECKSGGCVLKKQVCGDGDFKNMLCTNPKFLIFDPESIYCDLNDYIGCPNGCIDDVCLGTPVECTDGYMECRSDSVYNCVSGKWSKIEDCETECTNPQYNRAFCTYQIYYCKQSDRNECPEYDTKQSNLQCYDSLDECKKSYGYCCISGVKTKTGIISYLLQDDYDYTDAVYTWRIGSCQTNEHPTSGSSVNKESCEIKNIPDITECASCDAFVISNVLGGFMQDKKCIAHKGGFIPGYVFNLFEFLIIDTPLDVKFPQNNTTCSFSYLKFSLMIIVFIFSILFGIDFLEKFKSVKGKNKLLIRVIISALIGIILAYLIYTAFWMGLIVSALLIGSYVFIKFKFGALLG